LVTAFYSPCPPTLFAAFGAATGIRFVRRMCLTLVTEAPDVSVFLAAKLSLLEDRDARTILRAEDIIASR
jgi:hypothetical protein